MKEQAQLKEEMAYQYKIGNFEVKTFSYLSELKLALFFPALVVNKYTLNIRLRLLSREGWTQMFPCDLVFRDLLINPSWFYFLLQVPIKNFNNFISLNSTLIQFCRNPR